jgi:5'(3')-deoxyribonucleotidase
MTKPVALVDMDGTLVDYDYALQRDLARLAGPNEPPYEQGPKAKQPDYIKARHELIRRQSGWWRSLPPLQAGFKILDLLRLADFDIHILTKGPSRTTSAWSEKVEWCREYVPDATVHVTEDKSLVYGRILVDDWPPYIEAWLKWRPRGLVLMPHQRWNVGAFNDERRVLRCENGHHPSLRRMIMEQRDR